MRKKICILIVVIGFGGPLFFRVNGWPWTSYPMFCNNSKVPDVAILQVFVRSIDGFETRLPIKTGRVSDEMIHKALRQDDLVSLRSIIHTLKIDQHRSFSSHDEFVVYLVKAKNGQIGTDVDRKLLAKVEI